MIDIQQIKHDGAVHALGQAINGKLWDLQQNVFTGHRSGPHFKGMGKKIKEARRILDEIEKGLGALAELDPNND